MQISEVVNLKEGTLCYHCGDLCTSLDIHTGSMYFCCNGCKTVYEILQENNLCEYYDLDKNPGISQKRLDKAVSSRYSFLDDTNIIRQLTSFTDGRISISNFAIPQIHCSSCIWLLENLHKLDPAIIHSEVNFLQKQLNVKYDPSGISLRQIVELLVSIGYEPQISLNDLENKVKYRSNKSLYYKIGVAGFCFGNIMLLSFPEYLAIEGTLEHGFKQFFALINLLLGTPVLFYSASDYFKSAWGGLKQRTINIDFPIVLGLVVLFARSTYEIATNTGVGFIDSMTGLIFFLLLGKIFQSKTYDALNFERNYKSYFPISVTVKKQGIEKSEPVSNLEAGMRIVIRNNELIPADAILFNGNANIDYSFVTGESIPVQKVVGEIIYAGGRQKGSAIELEVIRTVSRSYLTQLWNKDTFIKKDEDKFNSLVNVVGKYFTVVILLIAAAAFIYWYPHSLRTAINAFTAVLIIACPCGIALTNPFALGNAVRILGRNKFYAKNSSVVERLSKIDTIVFDKTGTITKTGDADITFTGIVLNAYEQKLVKSLVRNSTHPLSAKIYEAIEYSKIYEVTKFTEQSGKGIEGIVENRNLRLGSALFAADTNKILKIKDGSLNKQDTRIFLSIDGIIKGFFSVNNIYRAGLESITGSLKNKYELKVLSGDSDGEKENLMKYFESESGIIFNQSPENKLEYIKRLQNDGKNILMIGDGLNDAGALKQSDVGIAVTEDITSFSPSCDAILDAGEFSSLNRIIKFSKATKHVIMASFAISVMYNIAGVSLAFQSEISPLLAAILMPASSITVVLFTVLSTSIAAKMKALK
ncbi:MAG: heavy metal translocating P-type ATPase metal-binding domain-containing protein [Ignavibacteria bacterium]|nr:heavy metal translocating P-type ATPase metal-binding domain-containing protein [Ignavibacteria bacterium]